MEEERNQKVYKVIMLVALTAIVTFLLTAIFMYKKFDNVYSTVGGNSALSSNVSTTSEKSLLKVLQEFKTILQNQYIGDIDEEKMAEGAIKGYIEGLGDPYTEYLTVEEMKELTEETDGKYVGIGVYVANNSSDNTILVVGVMNGSPALEAGMQAGDIITKIDETEYKGEELSKATSVLKGEEGTEVKVIVLRDGKEIELTITRKTISVEHVASEMLDNQIGYIQIDAFDDGVAEAFEEKYNQLKEQGIKGLIVDLRSNGGGVVDEATDIASMFTEKGKTVLITKSKTEKEEDTKSNRDPIVKDIPVVVLVNEGTASASEILAGALKDNYGAKIVGKKTYGKGVIQTVYRLTDGSGLKITTDEYFTPNHTSINKVGIEPDVEVDLTKDSNGRYETSKDNDAQLLKAIEMCQ
jgi:carboxyl-terminal processing protease